MSTVPVPIVIWQTTLQISKKDLLLAGPRAFLERQLKIRRCVWFEKDVPSQAALCQEHDCEGNESAQEFGTF